MKLCPITYEACRGKYSKKGLSLLSRTLRQLRDFPYTAKEQIELALEMASKLSIQGVQPKLSVRLNASQETFEVVEQRGTFILKPPHQIYAELPQNEDLTMRLAEQVGLEIPLHGMVYNVDGTFSYFIQRFDRKGRGQKLAVEDFSQLFGLSRETKYDASMEQVIGLLEKHCTFPLLEKIKLFRIALFNFLVGNEDMHLKNFSLIRRPPRVELSPLYDLVNSTIALKHPKEEIALSLRGKKSRLKREDFFDYFGAKRLGLSPTVLEEEEQRFQTIFPIWNGTVEKSFLSSEMKMRYQKLIEERRARLFGVR